MVGKGQNSRTIVLTVLFLWERRQLAIKNWTRSFKKHVLHKAQLLKLHAIHMVSFRSHGDEYKSKQSRLFCLSVC